MLAEDDLRGAPPDDPTGGGWADQSATAYDPPPPWSIGSAPGGLDLAGGSRSNGHGGAWPEQPAWANGATGGQTDPPATPWAGNGSFTSPGAHLEPPLVEPPPPASPNVPPAWVGEPTAPGAPDLQASWPEAPGGHRPGAREADLGGPADPLDTGLGGVPAGPWWAEPQDRPGRVASQPGGLGGADLPNVATTPWDQPEGPPAPPLGPSADPLTDSGRAANPAMPAWDYPTQPGAPPVPPAPEPWTGQGRPGATAAMPADPSWQARGPLPPSPRGRVTQEPPSGAGATGQAPWPQAARAAQPHGGTGVMDPGMGRDASGAWDLRPRREVAAGPAPSMAGSPWTPLDEVELPESRVDRFGDDHLHRRRSGHGRPRAGFWAEVPVLVVAAVVLAVLVKGFLVQAFYIPSRSMQPTLDVGDRVVVNRLSYRVGTPQRGQVVVFLRQTGGRATATESPISWVRRAVAQGFGGAPPGSEDLIKRVIAGPGDVVQGSQGRVWVNGRALAEPYLRRGSFTSNFGPLRVPPGRYWVMGDNREDSSDSRVFGPIPRSALVGHAVATVWPAQRLGSL
jgi:signal peptidase I